MSMTRTAGPAEPPASASGDRASPAAADPPAASLTGFAFVSPFLVVLTLFMLVPIGYAIYSSLYTTKLIGGTSYSGLANYRDRAQLERVLVRRRARVDLRRDPGAADPGARAGLRGVFDAGIARFGRFFRLVYFVPFAVPAVVAR